MYLKKWVVAAALLFTTGSYAQTVKLALAKGRKYEVTTVNKVNSVASVMGQEMENNIDNTTVEQYEVKDTRAQETDMAVTITKMKVAAQAMGQENNYDSEKKDNSGPMADAMDKVMGKVKNMTIDASGKIIKEDKAEEGGGIPMMMGGGGTTGDAAIIRNGLVGKELKVGASWPDSAVTGTDKMKVTTVGIYTVKSIENNIAVVLFAGTQNTTGVMEQMGQEMNMTGTSKVNGEIKIDLATGILLENNSSTDGTMTIEAAGMSIPVTMKSSTVSKIKTL